MPLCLCAYLPGRRQNLGVSVKRSSWRLLIRKKLPAPPPAAVPPRRLVLQCAKSGCTCLAYIAPDSRWTSSLRVLGQFLTDAQIRQIHLNGYFELPVGPRLYRVYTGLHTHNVKRVIGGTEVSEYCAVTSPYRHIPWPEQILIQALTLRMNEKGFLLVAYMAMRA